MLLITDVQGTDGELFYYEETGNGTRFLNSFFELAWQNSELEHSGLILSGLCRRRFKFLYFLKLR